MHLHQHPSTFVPTAAAEGHHVLAGVGQGPVMGRPVDPGDEGQG